MAEASAATTIHFPLPKRCADIRRGGVGEHGGGKRRHSSTARRARRVEEWRRLPPPCQAQPHLPPFVCVIKCRFPSQAASHLLGNGKGIVGAMAAAFGEWSRQSSPCSDFCLVRHGTGSLQKSYAHQK